MKQFRFIAALFIGAIAWGSCSPRIPLSSPMHELMLAEPAQLDGNYRPYVFTDWDDKALEKDYEAFYISHYGRHGSRFCTSKKQYKSVYDVLYEASVAGNLTARGDSLWRDYQQLYIAADGNAAKLTDRGREEHTALGKEMYRHYGSVFKPGSRIYACSTTVERVIESMNCFLDALSGEVPDLVISKRSEEEDHRFLNGVHKSNPRAAEIDFNNTSSGKNTWTDDA